VTTEGAKRRCSLFGADLAARQALEDGSPLGLRTGALIGPFLERAEVVA